MDRSTDVVAGAAVVSPLWFPWLDTTSQIAGMLVPILGATWLIIQIISHFRAKGKL